MNHELAKKLKDAGFPHSWCSEEDCSCLISGDSIVCFPTLSELIAACGDKFGLLSYDIDAILEEWQAYADGSLPKGIGATPEEAVARLWLALNKHVTA